MSVIKNIEKIPPEVRARVEAGLSAALEKKSLGSAEINFIQIENSLSGGKTGAAVFVARYGYDETLDSGNGKKQSSSFIRVLKIAPKEVCESENEGYVKTRETLLDIFSQVEYHSRDEFEYKPDPPAGGSEAPNQYGILLYQDVGTVAASDLKGVARYFTSRIMNLSASSEDAERFARELSLLLQKEVFLSLKKGLYGNVKRINTNLSEYYGDKLKSKKVAEGLGELRLLDKEIPQIEEILEYYNIQSTYHQVNFIHGDLNPENVLVWENERGFLNCKLIDFGEVMPKKRDNFTPLFWDFSRLLGEMILNFVEELLLEGNEFSVTNKPGPEQEKALLEKLNTILEDFWTVVEAFLKNDTSKLEAASTRIGFISRIYLPTLFDFLNEARSGIKDLRRAEVLQDYFYCQILFFLFFAKFGKENPYKRLFGVKFAFKLYGYATSGETAIQSLIESLESLYFTFSGAMPKLAQSKIGPAIGARSPFMGLSYFKESDREYFFGREKFTHELLSAIESKSILALAGASGSGKSSVVHAGVIPILREKGYTIMKFRPGSEPYQAALNALGAIPGHDISQTIKEFFAKNPNKKLFLLGDQFEEIFTLCTDYRQREDLAVELTRAAKEYKDQFKFFLTIRSDFWTKLLEDPSFASIVGNSGEHRDLGERFFLSPMNTEELRSVIEKPLEVAGLQIQEGLTDLILTSIAKEPGSLPLLEFCLEELWKKQIDGILNYKAYKEIGEVKGALATYAEQVYTSLQNDQKETLRKIMLQLVQPGQGTEDTRRVALLEDIVLIQGAKDQNEFINLLADKRLIVTGVDQQERRTVEVVHEALIREWKRLKDWINEDRDFRIWQEKLRYQLKEWESSKMDENLLLRGSSLYTALDMSQNRTGDLSQKEVGFIEASENKEKKRKRILWATGIIVSALILGFGIFGTINYLNARAMAETIAKSFSLTRDELLTASDLSKWSEDQGVMNWDQAHEKCKSLGEGWRLPKKGEWEVSYASNIAILSTKWLDESMDMGGWHWASEEYTFGLAYGYGLGERNSIFAPKENNGHVRCIR